MEIRKILCPVDFSEGSKAALAHAAMMAARFDAAIDLFHVREAAPYDMAGDVIRAESAPEGLAGQARTELTERLLVMIEEVAGAERARITPVVASGYPAQSILGRLEDGGYDLAVLGTAGRKGVAHLLMGSVAERVVRSAPCPVLTIRARTEPSGSE